jgi:hypothetical protein
MFGRLWSGEYSLPVAFWGFYVFGFVGLIVLGAVILLTSYALHLGTIGFIIFFLISASYLFISCVGVWRSAKKNFASPIWISKMWGFGARVIVLLFVGRVVWGLANGGALALWGRMIAPMDY